MHELCHVGNLAKSQLLKAHSSRMALLLQEFPKSKMEKNKDIKGVHPPVPPLPKRAVLDEKAEKYLREGGKIEDMPEGNLTDTDPQESVKNLKKGLEEQGN